MCELKQALDLINLEQDGKDLLQEKNKIVLK